ncbi:hypothetical protein KSP40_PGU014227 [Platanthera guangdongensis]|uniref:Uncharacterized protein n=1 Tax=Platanthera guangdongensis TaxID=2320717 RepID=A0ABR2MV36_9ASPA
MAKKLGEAETAEKVCVVTPKAEESKLKPVLICPPAPRKYQEKRKGATLQPRQGFGLIPKNLTTLFSLQAGNELRAS